MNDKAKSVNVQGGRIAQALGTHDFLVFDTVAERKKSLRTTTSQARQTKSEMRAPGVLPDRTQEGKRKCRM